MLNDNMINFSIAPIDGGWRWKTMGLDGRPGRQGVVATRALAAALVIGEIVRQAADAPLSRSAKAA
jgi:hypothetical protein